MSKHSNSGVHATKTLIEGHHKLNDLGYARSDRAFLNTLAATINASWERELDTLRAVHNNNLDTLVDALLLDRQRTQRRQRQRSLVRRSLAHLVLTPSARPKMEAAPAPDRKRVR